MTTSASSRLPWKTIATVGVTLTAVGLSIEYVDVGTHFKFDFITTYFSLFAWSSLVGVVSSCVGLIGWARSMRAPGRVLMAACVFLAPWLVILLGSPIGGTNIHGPAAFPEMLILPATILAVVLLVMAARVEN